MKVGVRGARAGVRVGEGCKDSVNWVLCPHNVVLRGPHHLQVESLGCKGRCEGCKAQGCKRCKGTHM